MPLYTYVCENKKCNGYSRALEVLVKLVAVEKEIPCMVCKRPMRKLMDAPFFKVG